MSWLVQLQGNGQQGKTRQQGGQLAAATAVVAAKSIIRFPEINYQKGRENGNIGIDDVTEYFLVGSFASWILALAGLALALSG